MVAITRESTTPSGISPPRAGYKTQVGVSTAEELRPVSGYGLGYAIREVLGLYKIYEIGSYGQMGAVEQAQPLRNQVRMSAKR